MSTPVEPLREPPLPERGVRCELVVGLCPPPNGRRGEQTRSPPSRAVRGTGGDRREKDPVEQVRLRANKRGVSWEVYDTKQGTQNVCDVFSAIDSGRDGRYQRRAQ